MTNTNVVILKGNLTRGLDGNSFGYANNGTARANVSIAVNRSRKQGDQWIDEVSYFDVTIWGKTAENLKPYLVKGASILVCGYLKQDRWEKDGHNFSKVTVIAEKCELCGGRKDGNSNGYNENNYSASENAIASTPDNDSWNSDPDGIPF